MKKWQKQFRKIIPFLLVVALFLLTTPIEAAPDDQTHTIDSDIHIGLDNGYNIGFGSDFHVGDSNGLWAWTDSGTLRLYNPKMGDGSAPDPFDVTLDGANITITQLFEDDTFTAHIIGADGVTSHTQIYVGNFGRPNQVRGATTWTYDESSQIVTINIFHQSSETITMVWSTSLIGAGGNPLLQYLLNGDFIGFTIACYTTKIGQGFYAILLAIIFGSLYNRTKSLILCAILWLLLGGTFLILYPVVSPIAIALVALGITGLLWKLHTTR